MKPNPAQLLSTIRMPEAQWMGLRCVTETSTVYSARDGRPEYNGRSISAGAMVEVLVDGQFGYAATNLLTETALRECAALAFSQAKAAGRHRLFPFSPAQRPASGGQYESPCVKPFSELDAKELSGLLLQLCAELKVSEKIVKASSLAELVETDFRFASTSGAALAQHFRMVNLDLEAVAKDGPVVQKRTMHGYRGISRQGGLELISAPDVIARAKRIGREALELVEAPECPTGAMDLVLAPDQMMLQIHESIGHPLELDRILGDERNYAGSSFVKLSDFGTLQYGSPLLNVSFDPGVRGEFASYDFDDTGVPARKEFLIQEGKLLRGLGSLESQARAQVPGVANARASLWNRAPIDRMANINIEPGQGYFEQIIGGIERGVYMESNRSWSIDDYRNKFQFGCEYARLIEGGKLTKVVRNPNYRGVTASFWHNLFKVGDASTYGIFGTPHCGKGEPNQTIRVGHASPVCAFRGVEVFGGAG